MVLVTSLVLLALAIAAFVVDAVDRWRQWRERQRQEEIERRLRAIPWSEQLAARSMTRPRSFAADTWEKSEDLTLADLRREVAIDKGDQRAVFNREGGFVLKPKKRKKKHGRKSIP